MKSDFQLSIPMARQTILVLGGGNALGSYLAGAYEALTEAGVAPNWIIGASAGAMTGAIIAGNPPHQRLARLREFWSEATMKTGFSSAGTEKLRQYYNGWHALWSVLAGRPTIFKHRWPGLWSALPGVPNDIAIMDHAPLRRHWSASLTSTSSTRARRASASPASTLRPAKKSSSTPAVTSSGRNTSSPARRSPRDFPRSRSAGACCAIPATSTTRRSTSPSPSPRRPTRCASPSSCSACAARGRNR